MLIPTPKSLTLLRDTRGRYPENRADPAVLAAFRRVYAHVGLRWDRLQGRWYILDLRPDDRIEDREVFSTPPPLTHKHVEILARAVQREREWMGTSGTYDAWLEQQAAEQQAEDDRKDQEEMTQRLMEHRRGLRDAFQKGHLMEEPVEPERTVYSIPGMTPGGETSR